MLVLTVRDGSSRSITRRLDGPVCIHPAGQAEPWLAYADRSDHGVEIVTCRHEPLARLGPGDAMSLGAVTLAVDHAAESLATERIVDLRRRRPELALVLPGPRRHALGPRSFVVGSGRGCDIVLADPTVSARHCEVVPHQNTWTVRDLGSTNGTWVGGSRVPAAELSAGVVLTLGRTRIECAPLVPPRAVAQDGLVGSAPGVVAVRAAIARYGPAPYPVLVEGESGVGKELVARELHACSPRHDGPLVAVNCGALAADVIESELFGHEKGAFTGAHSRRRGLFEEAHGGTLFLDEIGELPSALQPRLLRVLETGELRRVGAEGPCRVDVRVVSATLRDLEHRVAQGAFRADLFYRLSDFRVRVPPLRERRADIPALAESLLARIEHETRRHHVLEDHALGRLLSHDWPGNVRELLAVLKRAAYLTEGERIGPEHVELALTGVAPTPKAPAAAAPLAAARPWPHDVRDGDLAGLLAWCGGNVSRAALLAGLPRSTFRERLRREGGRGA